MSPGRENRERVCVCVYIRCVAVFTGTQNLYVQTVDIVFLLRLSLYNRLYLIRTPEFGVFFFFIPLFVCWVKHLWDWWADISVQLVSPLAPLPTCLTICCERNSHSWNIHNSQGLQLNVSEVAEDLFIIVIHRTDHFSLASGGEPTHIRCLFPAMWFITEHNIFSQKQLFYMVGVTTPIIYSHWHTK